MDVAKHWRAADSRYRLLGNECIKCKHKYTPKKFVCNCGSEEFKEIEYSGKGKLYSYTVVYAAPEGHERNTPYALGVVTLDEGVGVIAQIVDVDFEEIKIGMPLEYCFRKMSQQGEHGLLLYGYKFMPPITKA